MITKIKSIASKYEVLFKNFMALFILQGLNYILPLLTVPYLVKTLRAENYGITIFSMAFIGYFQIITDYGFNFSATRNISINKNNNEKVNEIFSSVMLIKILLCVICFIILILLTFLIDKFRVDYMVYLVAYGIVIGNVLFPVWFFQGIQQMKYITYINVIGKTFFTIVTFIVIRNPNDYIKFVGLNSLSSIFIGIISLILIFSRFKIRFKIPLFSDIKKELHEGWYVFETTLLSSVLIISGPFILGLFASKQIVGYYGAIDKIAKAFIGMFSPITQAIFPHISEKFKVSNDEGKNEILKLGKYVLIMCIVVCSLIFIFNKNIIFILYGNEYVNYSYILKYMSIWIFLSIINNFLGIQYLIGSGNGKYYSKAFTITAIVTLIIYLTLIKYISFNAIIIGTIIGEFLLTFLMIYFVKFRIENNFKYEQVDQ